MTPGNGVTLVPASITPATGQIEEIFFMPNIDILRLNVNPTPVRGRFLAHNHYDTIGRAFLAVDLHDGVKVPIDLTMTQAARLARVRITLAWWAKRRQAERRAIEAGLVPLVPQRLPIPKTNGLVPVLDNVAVLDFVRAVGVSRVLDAAVMIESAAAQ
jgi:hypothetical protein